MDRNYKVSGAKLTRKPGYPRYFGLKGWQPYSHRREKRAYQKAVAGIKAAGNFENRINSIWLADMADYADSVMGY